MNLQLSSRAIVFLFFASCLCTFSAESRAPRQRVPFPDARLAVHGLPWFKEDQPVLRRLPLRLKESFRPPVWNLAQSPSGGRIRFQTDSTSLGIDAENPGFSNMHHMPSVGENGVDLYVDGAYLGSAWPDANGKIVKEWSIGRSASLRQITLYLPLYKPVVIRGLTLDSDARLEPARPYTVRDPVVYYGSSITQGGCASNPGGSCQAILERRLDADFVNLGFSGSGLGDPAVAEAICDMHPSCIVLDFWGNPSPVQYAATLPVFVEILRGSFPKVPILVTSPFFFPAERISEAVAHSQATKRTTARQFVERRRENGDDQIVFVDGLEMLSPEQAEGLVDGVHCNSLGFYFNALGLEPYLRDALEKRQASREP
ncbi:MAG: SGNH/GDSL hydrolase family protein [Verrucomicrobiia bacterium]